MYPATIFTFKVSSIFSVHLGPKTRNLGASKRMREKKFFWNIFTFFSCSCNATLTCKRLFRYVDTSILISDLKNCLFVVFFFMAAMTLSRDFTFCPISPKRNFFGNLDCNFRKCFTKGFYWRSMKNFEISLWRQILHIYRRLLLRTSQVDTTLSQLQLSKSFKMLHKFSSWTHQSNFDQSEHRIGRRPWPTCDHGEKSQKQLSSLPVIADPSLLNFHVWGQSKF